MRSKWKRLVLCTVLLALLLTGCAVAKGLYADESPESDIEDVTPMEIVPAEEYQDWVEEKLDSGELKDLSVGDNHAYGTDNVEVVTDEETLEWLNSLEW